MSRSMAAILLLLFAVLLALPLLPGSVASASTVSRDNDEGNELRIGLSAEPETLDPHRASSEAAAIVLMNLFDPLIWRDSRGEFRPGLAEEWDVSADGKEYTFHLRDGVTFHDGTPFDAAAVKFNLDRIAKPSSRTGLAATLLGPYSHSEVIDLLTVRIVFAEPSLAFLDGASQPFLGMVSPKAARTLSEEFGHQPVGTGFMIFEEWVEEDHVALTRNDDYAWGSPAFVTSGPASFDRITFHVYPEESSRLTAFQASEVDILDRVQPRDIAVLGDARAYRELTATSLGVPISLLLNTDVAPTSDLAVRQALGYALNRDQVVSFAFRGASQPAQAPLAPDTPFAAETTTAVQPYDPDYAGSLLDAADWEMQDSGIREKDGQQLVLRWAIGPWDAQWAELAQAQFSELGAVVQIVQLDEANLDDAFRAGEINMMSVAVPGSDPIVLEKLFSYFDLAGDITSGPTSNQGLNALLHEGATARSEHKRQKSYSEAQALIMDEALIVPVALLPENVVVATEIAGIRRDFRNGLWLHDANKRDIETAPYDSDLVRRTPYVARS